jgi:hypothetical protein
MRTKKPFPPDIIKRIEALLSSIRIESCLRIRSKLGKQIREANFTGLVLLLNANWYKSALFYSGIYGVRAVIHDHPIIYPISF